jgi:hypothetical protein
MAHNIPTRRCGGCTLCCKLLPMKREVAHVQQAINQMIDAGELTLQQVAAMEPDFDKPSGAKCKHSRHGKGCAVYDRRPFGCRFWMCQWLAGKGTSDMHRPDRSHYVIDIMPDFIVLRDDKTGQAHNVEIVQIWLDPDFPNAHRDPALRAFLARKAGQGKAGLIRLSANDAFVIFAPSMSEDGQWHEVHSAMRTEQHTAAEILAVASGGSTALLEARNGR